MVLDNSDDQYWLNHYDRVGTDDVTESNFSKQLISL
jgi:hypothetical protein